LGNRITSYITSVLAIGEIINDKMPKTPSRLVPPQFGARVVIGALAGTAIGLSHGILVFGVLAGILGSVVGTFAGAKGRGLAAEGVRPRFTCRPLEDVLAIALAFVALR
jgi:uncharacterized membrane protein